MLRLCLNVLIQAGGSVTQEGLRTEAKEGRRGDGTSVVLCSVS